MHIAPRSSVRLLGAANFLLVGANRTRYFFKRNAVTPARNLRRGMRRMSAFALRRIQYFLENSISEDKNNYYGRVHCNDEPKQNTRLSTQPLYFFSGLSEFL